VFIDFKDFWAGELVQILSVMMDKARFSAAREFMGYTSALFFLAKDRAARTSRGFSNGRFVRNTFQRTWSRAANRLAELPGEKRIEELSRLELDNLPFDAVLGMPRDTVPLTLLRWSTTAGGGGKEITAGDLPATGSMPELTAESQQRLRALLSDQADADGERS